MSFPADPLKIITELFYDDAWHDISADVFNRNPVSITRGRSDEGGAVDPGSCSLTLNNGVSKISGIVGRYSWRNPRSDLWGKIGRGTKLRVSVLEGGTFFDNSDGAINGASTPDTAALDIAANLDIRWEGETDWYAEGAQMLIGKWGVAGQRSYHLRIENSQLIMHTTQDGTSGRVVSVALPTSLPRSAALRATVVGNNGASGNDIELFWAKSMSGTWRSLGKLTGTGTIAIFNSTSPLTIAPQQLDSGIAVLRHPFKGRCYRAEVRNGVNGTVVAAPVFEGLTAGTTSHTDSAGRVWSLAAGRITNRRVRFVGEVAEWPIRWNENGSDNFVTLVASGIMRRMSQGRKALDSALRRRIPTFKPLAYWPMESGTGTTEAANIGKSGGSSLKIAPVEWAAADTLVSSNPLPTLKTTTGVPCTMFGSIAAPDSTLSEWSVQWIYRNDNPTNTLDTYMRIISTGKVAQWLIMQSNAGSRVVALNDEGDQIYSLDIGTGTDLYKQWMRVEFSVLQVGSPIFGDITWKLVWTDVGGDAGQITQTITGGSIGRPLAVASPSGGWSSRLDGMALGHIGVFGVRQSAAYNRAVDAWDGEFAGSRIRRLASEEVFPLRLTDDPAQHSQLGPQYPEPLLTTLQDAADADGGILSEQRDAAGLRYKGRASFYNAHPELTLDFNARGLVTPVEPTDDDQQLRNDRTVERRNGGSARAVLETGPLSVEDVGTYDDSTTLNLFTDSQVDQTAWWFLRRGTVDEARYPRIMVDLTRAPNLISDTADMEVGDLLEVLHPPEWLPPGTISQVVEGYTETLTLSQWFIEFNCSPGAVWGVGSIVDDGAYDDAVFSHADTEGSVLAAPMGVSDGTVTIRTTSGPVWTSDPFDSPYELKVGGEEIRVLAPQDLMNANPFFKTDIAGWTAQSSTISRSTVQVHPRGEASLLITPDGVGTSGGATSGRTPTASIPAGATIRASMWAFSPFGWTDIRPTLEWYDAAGAPISQPLGSASTVPAGKWTYLTQTFVAPSNASSAAMRVYHGGGPSAADVYYVWAPRITRNTAGFIDTFTRDVTNGWGQADTGGVWNTSMGTAADYSVSGGVGRHTHNATNSARLSLLPSPAADVDLMADVGATANPAGAAYVGSLLARAPDDGNFYAAGITLNPGGSVSLVISKRWNFNSGVTLVSTTLPDTFTAGTFMRFRFQIFGSTLRAKGWNVGGAEPDWQLTTTDTQFTSAANIGLRTFRGTGNTNTGASILLDNFQLLDTQRFTVERAVNDVSKTHLTGEPISLAHPARVAL